MPSVGMPSSNNRGSTRGAPSAYTDAGPPDKTTAYGFRARTGTTCAPAPSAAIVRRLLRDRHVVRVALAQPGRGDADEARALHLLDRLRAAVPHRLPQAADELVQDV